MKRFFVPLAAAAALMIAAPLQPAAAASAQIGLHNTDVSAAKKKNKRARSRVHVYGPARGAYGFAPYYGYRNDPSLDPYGRPWRANFYATCYEDLGYGRFRDCSDF